MKPGYNQADKEGDSNIQSIGNFERSCLDLRTAFPIDSLQAASFLATKQKAEYYAEARKPDHTQRARDEIFQFYRDIFAFFYKHTICEVADFMIRMALNLQWNVMNSD